MIASSLTAEQAERSDSEDSESSVVRIGSLTSLRSLGSWIVNERTENVGETPGDFVLYSTESDNESRGGEEEENIPSEETPFLQSADRSDIHDTPIPSEDAPSLNQQEEETQHVEQTTVIAVQIQPSSEPSSSIVQDIPGARTTAVPKRESKSYSALKGVFRRFNPKDSAKCEKRRRRIRRRVDPAERVQLFLTNKWLRKNRHAAAPKYVRQSLQRAEQARLHLAEECGRLKRRLSERRSKTPKPMAEQKPEPTKPEPTQQRPTTSANSAPNFEYAIEFAAGSESDGPSVSIRRRRTASHTQEAPTNTSNRSQPTGDFNRRFYLAYGRTKRRLIAAWRILKAGFGYLLRP